MKNHSRVDPSRESARCPTARSSSREADLTQGNTPNSCGTERIPAQWTWHHRVLTKLHDHLAHVHSEPSKRAIASTEMLGIDVTDSPQEQVSHEYLSAKPGPKDDRLFEVDCALQRIRDGLYGLCEETGLPIPPERLQTIPWTRYCRPVVEIEADRRLGNPLTTRPRRRPIRT